MLQKRESPREAGFFVRVGWSGLFDAEGVTAGEATAVVEDDAVQLAADGRASRATGNAANESAENRAGETAEGHADRAADNAECGACFCTGGGRSDAARGSGDGADSAAGLTTVMRDFDTRRIAARANKIHETSPDGMR